MPMDRSEVQKVVDREMPGLMERFGIRHWKVTVTYGPIGDDGVCRLQGRCTRHVDYNRAHVELDPEEHDDEADLLGTLRHELYHVVLSPFDLYSQAADVLTPKASAEESMLERVWRHAVEQAAINLERLFLGLTASRLADPVDHTPGGPNPADSAPGFPPDE